MPPSYTITQVDLGPFAGGGGSGQMSNTVLAVWPGNKVSDGSFDQLGFAEPTPPAGI